MIRNCLPGAIRFARPDARITKANRFLRAIVFALFRKQAVGQNRFLGVIFSQASCRKKTYLAGEMSYNNARKIYDTKPPLRSDESRGLVRTILET